MPDRFVGRYNGIPLRFTGRTKRQIQICFAFIDYGNTPTGHLCFGDESSELPTGSSANYIFRNIKKGLPNMFLFNDFTPIRVQTNSDRSDF